MALLSVMVVVRINKYYITEKVLQKILRHLILKMTVLCWLSAVMSFRTSLVAEIVSPRRGLALSPRHGRDALPSINRLGNYPAQAQHSLYMPPHGALQLIIILYDFMVEIKWPTVSCLQPEVAGKLFVNKK